MTYHEPILRRPWAMNMVHTALLSFPIACFSLTVITDLAYLKTLNLLWLHFSEWLLLAGLVFGLLAAVLILIDMVRGFRPGWPAFVSGVAVMLLAALNSFIHTEDGWTAVMPYGIAVSVVTVLAMIVTGWLGRWRTYHV